MTDVRRRRPVFGLPYVVVVMALAGFATSDPNTPNLELWVLTLILCLPTVVPALPVAYAALSIAWNVTNADEGGATWPLTVVYVLTLGAVAAANVAIVRWWRGRRRHPGPDGRGAGATMR